MEVELELRVKPLPYKVKAMSRESPAQKAVHVLDTDLRTHWSTATNTKEWILLELEEPCLLSHIQIYNKSVLEWEIAVGLRYKPEAFLKVRPRCEAPRRDMIYPTNYTPCRYVRISCLRGNPIAIFFVQLIGVSVAGLEPEFQPVVNYLLPHIISHKQEPQDMHLQLLRDITNRLTVFLPQLEVDLTSFPDTPESNIRFLAMLSGPFYPILHVVNERTTSKHPSNITDLDVSKSSQLSPALTVSSNFEPRRSRGASPFVLSACGAIVFRPDAIFVLLRKAYKDSDLGSVCRMVSRILQKLISPDTVQDATNPHNDVTSVSDETSKLEMSSSLPLLDYSNLFGEEFRVPDEHWDCTYINILDVGAVEEGILHVLYACASQPVLCSKLAERTLDFWAALPLVQALLPALRPCVSSPFDIVDDNFSQWKQPTVQQALSQIVAITTSVAYHSLLQACAGYLSSFSPSHARAACVLIDLCSGVLAPWMAQVIAKIDLALELLEDLLGIIQDAHHSLVRSRAALKYIVLALSGHVDDILGKYKDVKHRILFLVEMLEPFLDPAIAASKSRIAFGDLSSAFLENQENNCMIALNIIRTAVRKPAVLPSLESEWRRGSVAPSVLLSILEPHMILPPDIDLCKSTSKPLELETASLSPLSSVLNHGGASSKSYSQDESDAKIDVSETAGKFDALEDRNLLFAPPELQSTTTLTNFSNVPNQNSSNSNLGDMSLESKHVVEKPCNNWHPTNFVLDAGLDAEYFNLQADYFQLVNYHDCELRASEFRRLALDLHSQNDIGFESHDAAVDALLLAAECYVNPYFMFSFGASTKLKDLLNINDSTIIQAHDIVKLKRNVGKSKTKKETIAHLEKERDKVVLQILLEAAELDRKYHARVSDGEDGPYSAEGFDDQVIKLSPLDVQSADAITLVRQNQALLCNFLIQRLQREQNSMHEVLMQCLVYFLHSATKLYCPPEQVIDIILRSAEDLNRMLASFHFQLKEGSFTLAPERLHGVQRQWILLQRLVIASSSGNQEAEFGINIQNNHYCGYLIPSSAWMQRISQFSGSVYPLVRFVGWMAVSRNAKQYMKDQVFLASDFSQLTYLLSIFADDLAIVDNVVNQKNEEVAIEDSQGEHGSAKKGFEHSNLYQGDRSFPVLYPELWRLFPNMKKQFETFGESILEAVGLQLRSISSNLVPDVLSWFSELCAWPFSFASPNSSENLKGYNAKNARAIILYILESIIVEHMEAMIPETPRIVQVLVSLSGAAYCDVLFLDSVLRLLKPIISYSLSKVSHDERLLIDDSCLNYEELCFNVFFNKIKQKDENQQTSEGKGYNVALTIFIVASVFPDLSIHHKRDFLQSLLNWANFAAFEPTTSFYDYLSAFQCVMDNCKLLLVHILRAFGVIPLQLPPFSHPNGDWVSDDNLERNSWFLTDICHIPCENVVEKVESNNSSNDMDQCHLSSEDLERFSKDIECLITELNPAIALCWNLHHQLTRKLTIASAECFVLSKCLMSVAQKFHNAEDDDQNSSTSKSVDLFMLHWRIGIEGLAEMILMLQESSCWEVSCLMLDCLLGVPHSFCLDNVIGAICSAIKNASCSAPKVFWRLQSDKWLSSIIARGIHNIRESEVPLIDLFCTLLGHAEPEQRIIALKHLGKLLGQFINGEIAVLSSKTFTDFISTKLVVSAPEYVLSHLVSSTWDEVVVLASSDASLQIRLYAMALLKDYIPFAERHQLQSFLAVADHICCLHNGPSHDGPILQLSLALIAAACLYSPAEDISLIPQNVWRNVEALGSTKLDGKLGDLEKRACQVLCRLRDEGDEAKEVLKEVLSSSSSKHYDPDFANTRESILQVLANLTTIHSYFEIFSKKIDQDDLELEEAEMELDIIRKEHALPGQLEDSKDANQIKSLTSSAREGSQLQQIRDCILSLEKAKLKEDIIARRQKKLLMRHARQKYLEEAALREAELLQELDRERAAEMEKELERQRLLELERAKTRELRHNLDLEKERQTQRELQRELEQAESGLRPSRRDFPPSTHSSRSRERFRERENGRSGNEGGTRAGSGSLQPEISTTSSSIATSPAIVLSGSRPFSGQLPTILQSRDRQDDNISIYEENIDGSKDSGDTSSIGDPELVAAFDGQSGGYGSQRHGSRGSKSRQVGERRDRDNRREGKWERKH